MTFDERAYRRAWAKRKRTKVQERERQERLAVRGKCPTCEMLMTSMYHVDCPGTALYMHISLYISKRQHKM